ncbi:MAG: GDP-mannose 4,6-dehydratase [Anaerolineae bacterium]
MTESFQPATTLVTGGAGFIGSNLCGALLARGERVICLDNFDSYYSPARKRDNIAGYLGQPGFTLIEADIRDRDLIQQVFAAHHPQRVAHLAAMAGVRYSIERAALYAEVNIQGTIHLLDAARESGVVNFVQASTSSVYGDTDQSPFVEDQPTDRPLAPYPATKKACEVIGHAYHNLFGLNFTAVRFFTVYGPRVRPDMMAYLVIERILNGEEIVLFDGGEMYRDWTYVDDIVAGLVSALDMPLGYEIINLGRGEPVRLGDFVTIIEGLVGKKARVKNVPAPASEPPHTFASIEKARRLLGYNPHVSIKEGLAHTWAWYQAANQTVSG